MTRYYRLKNGTLTWSCRGDLDVRESISGRIGIPSVEPDGDSWRLIIPLMCEEFDARIAVRLDEPEFRTLVDVMRDFKPDDVVTIRPSGMTNSGLEQLAQGDSRPPAPLVELLSLADDIVARMRLLLVARV